MKTVSTKGFAGMEIDLSQVRMEPTREEDDCLEARVTTPDGVALLHIDLSQDGRVGLTTTLPSGEQYGSAIDRWAGEEDDPDAVLRLAAAFVRICFYDESSAVN